MSLPFSRKLRLLRIRVYVNGNIADRYLAVIRGYFLFIFRIF